MTLVVIALGVASETYGYASSILSDKQSMSCGGLPTP